MKIAPADPLATSPDLGLLLEARVAELLAGVAGEALAKTLAAHRGGTIEPRTVAGKSGATAVETLRALGASIGDKLEMHQTLGEGGMGVVHLATQATVGRHVAVKTLRTGVTAEDATLRILREAWITGALEHPNIVPVYDVGVDASGAPVIVMKRIEGRSWADVLAGHREVESATSIADARTESLEILASVCNAIHFAHSRGILHRDLKPENVMIGAFGEVYVLDWGIAVSLQEDRTGRLPLASSATDIAGTPDYMAPEMLLGDPSKLSVRTDVYLLGAILYEIFTGTPPHTGDNLQTLVSSILTSNVDLPESVPEEVREICTKAMGREPSERYESVEAFREDIVEYLRHRGSLRLTDEASKSLSRLMEALAADACEERTREVQMHLGECRFGYRAALAAWPDNEEARQGLDRALLLTVGDALKEGDPKTAEALLREMRDKPKDVVTRVEAAVRERAQHDKRLHKLEADFDPATGSRTRAFIGGLFGVMWTIFPLLISDHVWGKTLSPSVVLIGAPILFSILGAGIFFWARESMMKTAINRGIMITGGVYQLAQIVINWAGHRVGLTIADQCMVTIFGWSLVYLMLAVWVEPWFGVVAATSLASLLVVAERRDWVLPLMSLDNFVFTIVFVRVWFPKGQMERIRTMHRARIARIRTSLHGHK